MSNDTLLNGRYKLVAQQGSGGMAVIYKAIDQSLGRTVAIKVLRPSLTADATFVARFQNEARSIANLIHPNIVTVHDVGNAGTTHYIVMEFVDGRDLKKVIRESGTLPVDMALKYSIGICAGLGFAHRAGLVHADVKPQNILLNKDNQIKITDFGIAQAWSDTQPTERQSVVWGSPHYFAPEQAQGEKPTAAADVYSIGIVMFEMLAGRLPFTGTNQQELALAHIQAPIPLVTDFNPAVPEILAQIIYKAMSKKASDRYRMADQLGRILLDYRDKGAAQTMPGSPVNVKPSSPPAIQTEPATPLPTPSPEYSNRSQQPPLQALPTQRYSPAPEAPAPINYDRRPIPSANITDSKPLAPPRHEDSRPSAPPRFAYNQDLRDEHEEESVSLFDGVTLTLAILAFTSVACLVPLYIAVFIART